MHRLDEPELQSELDPHCERTCKSITVCTFIHRPAYPCVKIFNLITVSTNCFYLISYPSSYKHEFIVECYIHSNLILNT